MVEKVKAGTDTIILVKWSQLSELLKKSIMGLANWIHKDLKGCNDTF